jgi:hypothetical protein
MTTQVLASQNPQNRHQVVRTKNVEVYDFIELHYFSKSPVNYNPFTEVSIAGEFTHQSGELMKVEGFCDSQDGRLHKIRFMPTKPGRYTYQVTISKKGKKEVYKGNFQACKVWQARTFACG